MQLVLTTKPTPLAPQQGRPLPGAGQKGAETATPLVLSRGAMRWRTLRGRRGQLASSRWGVSPCCLASQPDRWGKIQGRIAPSHVCWLWF